MAHHNDIHGRPILRELFAGLEDDAALTLAEDIMEFVGPFTGKIGETPYITFTQFGIKAEGEAPNIDDEKRCWTEDEAMWRFRGALREYLLAHPARQIAWRGKPHLERGVAGDFIVRCRFALLGKPGEVLQAVA